MPTVRFGYCWDDTSLIRDNQDLTAGNPLALFGRSFAVQQSSGEWQKNQYYRPLVTLSFWLDRQVWGRKPFGFHLTNVLLNLVVSVLVGFLFRRLLSSLPAALLGGLAFVLHPMHVEAVAFISGRTDLVMSLFVLVALLALLGFRSRPNAGRIAVIMVAYCAALLSKETAVVFPLLAFFGVGLPGLRRKATKPDLLLFGLLVVLTAAFLGLRTSVLKGYTPPWEAIGPGTRATLVLNAVGRYAALGFVPFFHRLVYPGPGNSPGSVGRPCLALRQ